MQNMFALDVVIICVVIMRIGGIDLKVKSFVLHVNGKILQNPNEVSYVET